MTIHEALREFAESLTRNFSVAELSPAQAEDQLKGPMQTLSEHAGQVFGREVIARTEARTDLGVRPDLGVTVDGLVVGHVELKAPGKGVKPSARWDAHDKEQFKKLADHPNLLYADGNEWALYRDGKRVGFVARAEGDIRADGPDS